MTKIIGHIDLNAFFVRCEELRNPSLSGKAVAIGHRGRGGIISTCSYKAREYGVHSGQPTFEALKKCPSLILIDGHYHLYEEKSQEFFRYLKQYSSLIEKASVDECYIDLTSYLAKEKEPLKKIKEIQDGLLAKTGLMCSIGISINKFLAKMGSDLHKPMGITIIHKKDIPELLYPLKIDDFFGIGKKTTPKLKALGILTIGDLAKKLIADDEEMRRFFGRNFYTYRDLILGKGSDEIITVDEDAKSLGHSKTLSEDLLTYEELVPHLIELTKQAVNEIIKENYLAKTVQITLKDHNFKTITRSKKLDEYCASIDKILPVVESLLMKNLPSEPIRLVGVTLQELVAKNEAIIQLSLFDNYEEIEEECRTKLLINELNRRLKKPSLTTLGEIYKEKKYGIK